MKPEDNSSFEGSVDTMWKGGDYVYKGKKKFFSDGE